MKKFRRVTALLLSLLLVFGLMPVTGMTAFAETSDLTIVFTEVTAVEPSGLTSQRNWSAVVTGPTGAAADARYDATLIVAAEGTSEYSLSSQYSFKMFDTDGFSLVDSGFTKTQEGTAYKYSVGGIVTATSRTVSEIQSFLNNSLYLYSNTDGNYPWIKMLNHGAIVNQFTPSTYTISVVKASGDTTSTEDGTGTITVNGTAVAFDGTTTVPQGNSVTVVMTPDEGSYLAAYSVGTESADAQNITEAKNFTFTPDNDVTIQALFLKKVVLTAPSEPSEPSDSEQRDQGALQWSQVISDEIAYKDAVADNNATNFNACVKTYLLNSYFGTSIYYGVNPLPDPSVYMYLTMSDNSSVSMGTATEFVTLDRDSIGGKTPSQNGIDLAVTLDKTKIVPGSVTQAVYADYTTANSICGNHWYHVYGVKAWKSKLERTFTIAKDVLGFYNNGAALTNGATFTFNANGEVDGFNPQLLPASYWETASQAMIGYTSQNAYTIYDSNGNPVENNKITKAGEYTIKNNAFTETTYIQGYEANTVSVSFTVKKGTNPTTVVTPVITAVSATSITLDPDSIVDGQNYQFTSGGTTYTGAQLKEMGYVISGLSENTSYTLATELPATDMYEAQQTTAAAVTTYVSVTGSIALDESDPASAPLLAEGAIVTFSDGTNQYTATVDANGDYSLELPAGNYTVSVVSADGTQEGTLASYTVADNTANAPEQVDTIYVKDNANGKAKKAAKAFLDNNLNDGNGGWITSATRDNYLDILASKDAYYQLSDAEKAYVDELLGVSYTSLLADAQDIKDQIDAENFVATYLTDTEGNVYTQATNDNYEQIISGADAWKALNSNAQGYVNAALTTANGGNALTYPDLFKSAAELKLAAALNAQNAAIDAMEHLSEQEKADYKAAIAAAVSGANLETATDVNAALLTAMKSINSTVLDAAAQNAQNAIDKLEYLSDAEKTQYKQDIADAATTAKQNVADATTAKAVDEAMANGVKAIDALVLAAAKDDAKTAIEAAAEKRKAELSAMNISAGEKAQLLATVDALKELYLDQVADATTPVVATAIIPVAVEAINAVRPAPVEIIYRSECFATTVGEFKDVAYFGTEAKAGDVVTLKVSLSELGEKFGLDYKKITVVYEVEGAVMLKSNFDYSGDPIYKDGIATEFMLSEGFNKVVATVYYNGFYAGEFAPFYCNI